MKRVNVMTLEEYKSQCKAIKEKVENFNGTQEETIKFLEDLATKYPEVNEFNTKALQCKNVTEFKKLADSFGMKFSDDDSAEKLYSLLDGTKKQLQLDQKRLEDGVELSDDGLELVRGGFVAELVAGLVIAGIVGITIYNSHETVERESGTGKWARNEG